jgi:hypothetical protein
MDEMDKDRNEGKPLDGNKKLPLGLIPLQAGCLTFALATVAILVGLWLDTRLGTAPRWMLILLIGSAPFTLGGVFFFVRASLRRMRAQAAVDEGEDQHDE